MSLLTMLFLLLIAVVAVHLSQRRGGPSSGLGLALLSVFLALPARAQDPQGIPPVAPPETPAPGFADTQAGATAPEPKGKAWSVSFEAGPSTVSTPQELKPFATIRATVYGEPWLRTRLFFQARADRTPDGAAFSIDTLRSFRAAEALAGGLYRLKNSPVSVLAVGSLSWSLENGRTTLRDPQLWSFGGGACVERFAWWPEGGLFCLAGGRWAGRDGVRFDVTQPLKGGVTLVVGTDVPFRKLPEFLRALPGAVQSVPLAGPPTAEQIAGVAQKLPISVRVGVVVRGWGKDF